MRFGPRCMLRAVSATRHRAAVDGRAAIASAAEIVGHKWTALILNELADGPRRFRDLERACEGISTRTLAERLRALEHAAVVDRESYHESPPRVEYALTAKGEALLPVVDEMRRFGAAWTDPA
jgi:DNA-binding HxlR family transcriptional regulator